MPRRASNLFPSIVEAGLVSAAVGRTARCSAVARYVRCSPACRRLLSVASARELTSLLDAYECGDLAAVALDAAVVLAAAGWRCCLEARYRQLTAEAVRGGRADGWLVGWVRRWPRLAGACSVACSSGALEVRWLGPVSRPVGKRARRLASAFAAFCSLEQAASGASLRRGLRLVRASGTDGSLRALSAGAAAAGAAVIRCPAQRGLGLCGSREFARLVARGGAAVLVTPDADRLGRVAAPAVADLLAVAGVGVRLGAPDLAGTWRPGSRHATDDAALDGLCVGPRVVLGPGPDLGRGSVLARLPASYRPTVVAESAPDRPLVFLAALCSRLLPDRVVLLRAGHRGVGSARLVSAGRARPADLAGFAALGADAAVLRRARRAAKEALSARHDAAAAASLAASSRHRRRGAAPICTEI